MNPSPIPNDLAAQAMAALDRHHAERQKSIEMAEQSKADFKTFLRYAWPIMEPTRQLIWGWHLDAMCQHLQAAHERKIIKLLINIPPGSAKSLVTSVAWPAWIWTKNPGFRGTFASYGEGLSTRDSVRCRDLMQSVWYQETFNPGWKFSAVQNEKTYYANTMKGFRVSTSVGGKGTGWRGNCILVDDPHNINDEHSDKKWDEVIHWWDSVMFNRLDDMKRDLKIIIMQRISDRDLSGHVLREGGYEHLMIPNEYEPDRSKVTSLGWRDPRTERLELMCEELLPREITEEFKKNPGRYQGQYQQNPHPEGAGILKAHRWNYWKPKGLHMRPVRVRMPGGDIVEREAIDLPEDFDFTLQSWDMSFKELKNSDFVAGGVIGVHGANRFLLDAVNERMDIVKTMQAVRRMTAGQWGSKADVKLVEGKANGPAVIQMLKDEIAGFVEVEPEGGKVSRARTGSYEQASGNWYLPHPDLADWVGDPADPATKGGFLQQTTAFPNGANDDMVDMWSQGAIRIKAEIDGAVFKTRNIEVQPHEIPPTWKRVYGLCVTWNEIAAVWLAQNPENKNIVIVAEYWANPTDPAIHVKQIREQGAWIPGVIAAQDSGRDRGDGYALAEKYMNLGLKLEATPLTHDVATIADLNAAFSQGTLKVFSNTPRFMDQYRLYRRDSKGKLPATNVALMKALETAWEWGRDIMMTQPGETVQQRHIEVGMFSRDNGGGWMRS